MTVKGGRILSAGCRERSLIVQSHAKGPAPLVRERHADWYLTFLQAMALVSRHPSLHSLNMKGVKQLDAVWHDLLQSIPG